MEDAHMDYELIHLLAIVGVAAFAWVVAQLKN